MDGLWILFDFARFAPILAVSSSASSSKFVNGKREVYFPAESGKFTFQRKVNSVNPVVFLVTNAKQYARKVLEPSIAAISGGAPITPAR